MKRVLIAKQNMSKKYSGATRSVYEQIRYFKSKGFDVRVAFDEGNISDLEKANTEYFKTFRWPWEKKIKRRVRYSFEVDKIIEKFKPHLSISHGDHQNSNIYYSHNCVHLAHERVYGEALKKDNDVSGIHSKILEAQKFDLVIANSNFVKKDLVTRFEIPEKKVEVIYPALNISEFPLRDSSEINDFRAKHGVKEGEYFVGLITSGAFRIRNLKLFFDAINILPEDLAGKCRFVFVGKDKIYPEAQESLDQSKYKDRIKHIEIESDVSLLFSTLDLFVLPAKIDAFGRVVAEAMICGLPVITTNWVGASEILDGISRDFIFSSESPEELSDLIRKVLENESLRKELSVINRESSFKVLESEIFKSYDRIFSKYFCP